MLACRIDVAAKGDWRLIRVLHVLLPLLILIPAGCVTHQPLTAEQLQLSSERLSHDLMLLHPSIDKPSADKVARVAIEYTAQLATDYKVSGSPRQHNFLVNLGVRQRGLCFHWTDDLLKKLQSLKSEQFDFHSAVAHRNSDLREHSSVVVTFKGAPFASGMVLDGWRYSGDLYWMPVSRDSYPWSPRYPKQKP